jgi:hypothetical protein
LASLSLAWVRAVTDKNTEKFHSIRKLNALGEALMLALAWLLAFLCAALILGVLPAVAWFEVRRAYSGKRKVNCPETNSEVDVQLDASLAARSRFLGRSEVTVAKCSRWPLREACAEGCVPEAITKNQPDSFAINHVGVLAAAFASTAVAGLLRCSPMAREWMSGAGYPTAEFWQNIALRAPAVFTLVAMVVTAYVLTWLMRHLNATGVTRALEVAALVWLAVASLAVPEIVFFYPVRIFAMNALLSLIALLVQGAILGLFVVPQPKMKEAPSPS